MRLLERLRRGEIPTEATPGVMQEADPARWEGHRYGLTTKRWGYLKGKSFWVTGAGTGYGRCLAAALALAGGQVFLTGRRRWKLEETLEEIGSYGISPKRCHIVVADITDTVQVESACDKVRSLCSSLYGLVNNAALSTREGIRYPLKDESVEYWDRIIRTNVTAPWLLTKSMFPHMMKKGEIRVLFLSSGAGWAFTPGFGPYNVSKAALNNLSVSLAEEYGVCFPDVDIQMNVLVPGEARTEMNQNSMESPYSVVSMALILLSHPKGGPNGKFFHRDGRHLGFAKALPYCKPLI